MKYFSLLLISLMFLNCRVKKSLANHEDSSKENIFIGVVHVSEGGCPWYIEISEDLNPGKAIDFVKVYPINLKDGMKKKGLKVSFNYTLSKALNPEGCTADAVVQIEQIQVIP